MQERYPLANVVSGDIGTCLSEGDMLQSFKNTPGFQNFNLITFTFGLHWLNDIILFLKQVNNLLSPKGIFVANFVGGGSLKNLRSKLIEAETKSQHFHSAHISPFIPFDQVALLLQYAGFKEMVVDFEKIELEYASPLALMKAIKYIGESNTLAETPHYAISKKMLAILKEQDKPFYDTINLISITASKNKNSIQLTGL